MHYRDFIRISVGFKSPALLFPFHAWVASRLYLQNSR
jgi:hypothetical protein